VELLRQAVPASVLVVAVDPGKVSNRVWLTSGERGLIGEPVSLPVLREGIDTLAGLIGASGVAGSPVIGVEATGGLHRAWVAELERRFPGSVRLVAPRRRRQPGRSSARGATRPTIGIARRWCGCCARALAGQSPRAAWRRYWARSVTDAGWSPTGRSSSSGCMTSSRRCAWSVGPGWPRPRPGPGRPDRPGGAGVCGHLRRPAANGAVAAGSRAGSADQGHRQVLGRPLAAAAGSTRRRRAARRAAGP
jgi:hypothetical protein